MADKTVTVEVPEDRVPEFYLWFAAFLASAPGSGPPRAAPRTAAGAGEWARGATTSGAPGPRTTSKRRAGSTAACRSPRASCSTS